MAGSSMFLRWKIYPRLRCVQNIQAESWIIITRAEPSKPVDSCVCMEMEVRRITTLIWTSPSTDRQRRPIGDQSLLLLLLLPGLAFITGRCLARCHVEPRTQLMLNRVRVHVPPFTASIGRRHARHGTGRDGRPSRFTGASASAAPRSGRANPGILACRSVDRCAHEKPHRHGEVGRYPPNYNMQSGVEKASGKRAEKRKRLETHGME